MKQSGVGPKSFRDHEALHLFTEPKNVCIAKLERDCDVSWMPTTDLLSHRFRAVISRCPSYQWPINMK
jgi:hypothetical protein